MANEQNLRPIKLTHEEAMKNGAKGGKASGKARRERRSMRETAEYLLNLPQKPGKVTTVDKLRTNKDISDANLTNQDQIILKQIEQARKGNPRAAEFLRDLIGEKPTDKQEITVSGNVDVNLETADINTILAEVRRMKEADE